MSRLPFSRRLTANGALGLVCTCFCLVAGGTLTFVWKLRWPGQLCLESCARVASCWQSPRRPGMPSYPSWIHSARWVWERGTQDVVCLTRYLEQGWPCWAEEAPAPTRHQDGLSVRGPMGSLQSVSLGHPVSSGPRKARTEEFSGETGDLSVFKGWPKKHFENTLQGQTVCLRAG